MATNTWPNLHYAEECNTIISPSQEKSTKVGCTCLSLSLGNSFVAINCPPNKEHTFKDGGVHSVLGLRSPWIPPGYPGDLKC